MKIRKKYLALALLLSSSFLLTQCSQQKTTTYPGYVQGKFIYISAYYKGTLEQLQVSPGDTVKKGQPLFTLAPYPENADLMAANARVQQALDEKNKHEANFNFQKNNNVRNQLLFKKEVISKEELEQSNSDYRAATASQKAAEANLLAEKANQKKAAWVAGQKTVTAPVAGFIFDTYYAENENVAEGKPILSLLPPNSLKIIFYIPQDKLGSIALKQKINAFYDGSSQPVMAEITYISPKEEYTPPVIFSKEERQNLVFRVEALPIDKDGCSRLHPGQPLSIKLQSEQN